MDALTPNVFDSPALGILCDLEADGFRVALTADDALSIAPRSRLTPERMQAIAAHKDAIKTLLRCCDEGVVVRRDAFRAQFDAAPVEVIPALLFRADVRVAASPAVTRLAGRRSAAAGGVRWPGAWRVGSRFRLTSGLRWTPRR
jgi:hypothetical protein